MATPIIFGTDGWRGIIADDFTFENVRVCAQGVADYLNGAGLARHGLVVGYDTRFASEDFAA
ncbi:MAG: phosphoglucomutase/phosphomannomutase family protein, partial [Dehalococcoidia bacterium]|nr:phosphoglucomutase/phosphomannomutase family protein [Dehalococcoidia bacterium]